jgi:NAD(P)-dependent dehydrogenase (short-subunit alcohol dehydrogenase family)
MTDVAIPSISTAGPPSMPIPAPDCLPHVDLAGRAILITGATGGLGHALARACAAAGATVVLHGRIVRKLEALYDEIVAAGDPQPTILPLDLATAGAEDYGTVASAIRAQLGRLDAIVHTANALGSLGPIEHQAFDAWLQVLRVDLIAAMALTRAAAPLLAAGPDASVVFTLDTRGQAPRAYWGAYAVAKAGLAALATVVADEWENRANLRVNAVVPGPIDSPLRAQTHPGEDRAALPPPRALVPLYLYLVGAQPKAEAGVVIDGAAWLAGHAASTPLLPASAAGARP